MLRIFTLGILILTGCGQFDEVGAYDKIQSTLSDATMHASDEMCSDNSDATFLTRHEEEVDGSAGGQLSGPTISWDQSVDFPIIVALDHSGSMYPGYKKGKPYAKEPFYWTTPGFINLLQESATQYESSNYHVRLYNSSVTVLGDGLSNTDALNKIRQLPKTPRDYYGTWDPAQSTVPLNVIKSAEKLIAKSDSQTGIVWLITDNIADVGGDEAQHTARFYQYLSSTPQWQMVRAYPVTNADWLGGSTLMFYALQYSTREMHTQNTHDSWVKSSGSPLNTTTLQNAFKPVSTPSSSECNIHEDMVGHAVQLKPNYLDIVNVGFSSEIECKKGTTSSSKDRSCSANIYIKNALSHRRITEAEISIKSNALIPFNSRSKEIFKQAKPYEAGVVSMQVNMPGDIAELKPFDKVENKLEVKVKAPEIETQTITDLWMSANTPRFTLSGSVDVEVHKLKTVTEINTSCMANVYGVNQLPSIFADFKTDEMKDTACMDLVTHNPNTTFAIVVLSIIGAIVTAVFVIVAFFRPQYHRLYLDGTHIDQPAVRFVPYVTTHPVKADGMEIATIKLGKGGRFVVRSSNARVEKSHTGGNQWSIIEDGEFGNKEFTLRVEKGLTGSSSLPLSANDSF